MGTRHTTIGRPAKGSGSALRTTRPMNILELRTERERTLFTISLVVSCVLWAALILGTFGLGLVYVAAGAGVFLLTQAMFLAALKSSAVKITPDQLPELHARIIKAAERLQLKAVPEAYLLNERGIFNAFATRFLGRDFIVLYAELLEACDERDGSIEFIIGHELGHLALNHVKLAPVLLPSRAVPLLGPAYSRAREYSCDRAGTVAAQHPDGAIRGLAVLAGGRRYSKRINVERYLDQRRESAGFWSGVVELGLSHPYLPKRMGAILADTKPEVHVPKVERNPFAYVVAPFFGGGGAGAAAMASVMLVGMFAAIAIPSVLRAKERSADAVRRTHIEVPRHEPASEAKLRALEVETKAAQVIEDKQTEVKAAVDRAVKFDPPPPIKKTAAPKAKPKSPTGAKSRTTKRLALPPPSADDGPIY
jgi:Zn-dependent protease with chaperone function